MIVTGIEPESKAEESGIRVGDIILEVDKKPIKNEKGYKKVIKELENRKKAIAFLISRDGNTLYLAVKPE